MKQTALILSACLVGSSLAAQDKPARPKITGIDHVRIYASDMDRSDAFYGKTLQLHSSDYLCASKSRSCFLISWSPTQYVELEQTPSPAPKNWLAEVAFATDDIAQMRRYLMVHGASAGPISRKDVYGVQHFEMHDPEGNPIAFVQRSKPIPVDDPSPSDLVGARLLHAGFVVKDLAVENRFYMDLLGFRLYWHGGFKDQDTDWYEIQVPDGDNWIEYMLNIPANADHKDLGVQNHFSLGVKDAKAAAAQLRKNGLQEFDGPEIGRDGKNSLDAYDPDGTRVEIMEFTPTQKPCCHPYTAPHPKP
ncbi:MAG: VOC family protein [Candidatus Acidiferrum sp.]